MALGFSSAQWLVQRVGCWLEMGQGPEPSVLFLNSTEITKSEQLIMKFDTTTLMYGLGTTQNPNQNFKFGLHKFVLGKRAPPQATSLFSYGIVIKRFTIYNRNQIECLARQYRVTELRVLDPWPAIWHFTFMMDGSSRQASCVLKPLISLKFLNPSW